MSLIEEAYRRGIKRPSSYADFFAQLFESPRVSYSVNMEFDGLLAGGWEAAKKRGRVKGSLERYDMISAYLWSVKRGLPDPATFSFTDTLEPEYPGVYAVTLREPNAWAPYPFNVERKAHMATLDEMETYHLDIEEVHGGVVWSPRLLDGERLVDLIQGLPAWKQVARGYWGRWASTLPVECVTKRGKWALRNPVLNLPWAHHVISGVKRRMYPPSRRAVHVFVDSIITPMKLATGTSLGDWRHEETYTDGLVIRGPGIYGEPGKPLIKHAGIKE